MEEDLESIDKQRRLVAQLALNVLEKYQRICKESNRKISLSDFRYFILAEIHD